MDEAKGRNEDELCDREECEIFHRLICEEYSEEDLVHLECR